MDFNSGLVYGLSTEFLPIGKAAFWKGGNSSKVIFSSIFFVSLNQILFR